MTSEVTQPHHVHFDEGKDDFHDHEIRVQRMADDKAIVHIGLIKIHHKYEVQCLVPNDLLPKAAQIIPDEEAANKNCRLLSMSSSDAGCLLKVELIAHKEKLQKDTLILRDEENAKAKVELIFQSRVMGKHTGTPMLREGVHLVASLPDPDESEAGSDWKGF